MTALFHSFVREPLVHFLLAGAAIFGLYELTGGDSGFESQSIIIDEREIAGLAAEFAGTRQRPPTREEMEGLVEQRVRDEVLYREALRMGLDRGDVIVRRRMRTKMDYLAEQKVDQNPPDDAELAAYAEAHPERYGGNVLYDFRQIYLGQGDEFTADKMAGILKTLNAGAADPARFGQRISLPAQVENTDTDSISRIFGRDFAAALENLDSGTWSGPVRSGFGLHLVKIGKRTATDPPPLADIRQRVRNDWRADKIAASKAELYDGLRSEYDIEIAPYR